MTRVLARAAIKNFVTYNPLFLFSALLLLGGAWLINPPRLDGGRDRVLLLQLFGVVQGYELALLGAAVVLARRGLARDVRNLVVLVLAPFLMDISCTNALTAEQTGTWPGHLLAVVGLLALVGLKGAAASRLVGVRFAPVSWAALLGGPLVVTAGPLVMSFLAHHGFEPSELTLAAGLLMAALVLLWGLAHDPEAADSAALRALAPVVLGVATWHALGMAWSHGGSFLHIVGPMLVALGPVLPRLAWPHLAARDAWTPLVLPALGAVCCGLPGLDAPEPFIGLSAWQLGLGGMAVAHGIAFGRHGALPLLLGVLVAVDLAAGGATLETSLRHVGRGAAEPAVLLALFGYGLHRRAHPLAVFTPLAAAAVLVSRLELLGGLKDLGLCVDLFAAGLLAWTHRTHGTSAAGARFRFAGCTLLWLPVQLYALRHPGSFEAVTAARTTLVALVGLAVVTRVRGYAIPALILPVDAAVHVAPSSTSGWGALGIGLAFASVAGGVLVSLRREAILAWLERLTWGDDDDALAGEEAPRPAPAAFAAATTGAGPGRGGVVLASLLGVLLVPAALAFVSKPHAHGRDGAAQAIGALKTIATAQTLFREGDMDHDGVLDYANSLKELADADLVDPGLATTAERGGHRISVCAGDPAEFVWMATATPVDWRPGDRCFAVSHMGVVYMSTSAPFTLRADCQLDGVALSK